MTIFNPLRNDADAAGTIVPTGSLFESGMTLLFWTKDREGNILTDESAAYIRTIEDYITTEHVFNDTTYEDFCFKVNGICAPISGLNTYIYASTCNASTNNLGIKSETINAIGIENTIKRMASGHGEDSGFPVNSSGYCYGLPGVNCRAQCEAPSERKLDAWVDKEFDIETNVAS